MLSNGRPMRDWRAAVRNWEGRDNRGIGKYSAEPPQHDFLHSYRDYDELEKTLNDDWDECCRAMGL